MKRLKGSPAAQGAKWIMACACVCALVLGSAGRAGADDKVYPDLIRRIQLQWEKDENATGYELELGLDSTFASTLYNEKTDQTQFAVDLLPGSYFYRVRSIDPAGRPGRWTPIQELSINARPPLLLLPKDHELIRGNLPDDGLELEWRTSGPGIRYLVEIKAADQFGNFNETLVKQEVNATYFKFFPQDIGKYQWSVHTLGAGGDEPGVPRDFEIEGVIPYGAPPDSRPVVRYVPPWWRGHWTLYARYGQAAFNYSIVDQDFRVSGGFTGLTGYTLATLNWEWHDPVSWNFGGIPWFEFEFQLDRQTVLDESVVLPRWTLRVGSFARQWVKDWRFTPVIEYGIREVSFYQPLSPVRAVRSNSLRNHFGLGVAAEWQFKSYLSFGASAKVKFEHGGRGGIFPVGGNNPFLDSNRAGNLHDGTGVELSILGAMSLGQRIRVQGKVGYELSKLNWTGHFTSQSGDPDTHVSLENFCFDVAIGLKF